MKRTDKEIIEAMTFIQEQHNGEIPYEFGYFECAKMMAKYLKKQLTIPVVVESLPQDNFCIVCNLPTDGEKCYSKRCPV